MPRHYVLPKEWLIKYLPLITNNNAQQEYYLTDIVEIIKTHEVINIDTFIIPEKDQIQIEGINSKEDMQRLEKMY